MQKQIDIKSEILRQYTKANSEIYNNIKTKNVFDLTYQQGKRDALLELVKKLKIAKE